MYRQVERGLVPPLSEAMIWAVVDATLRTTLPGITHWKNLEEERHARATCKNLQQTLLTLI